jgi:hypothetical protein
MEREKVLKNYELKMDFSCRKIKWKGGVWDLQPDR